MKTTTIETTLPTHPTPRTDSGIDYRTIFPPVVADYISEISRHYQISADFLSVSALSVMATAAATHIRVTEGRYVNPLVLWFVIVAPSGSNKTYALKLPVEPLREIDRELFADYQRRYSEWQERQSQLPKNRRADSRGEQTDAPVCQSILIDDCTDEKRNDVLFRSQRALLSVYPEFGGFFGDRTRYSSDGSSAISRLLKLFDGDDIKVDRKSGGTMLIRDPKFNILGDIQPEIMVKEFGRESFLRNGLNQRFLFAVTTTNTPTSRLTTLPDPAVARQWREMVRSMVSGITGDGSRQLYPAPVVRLSRKADALYTDYYNEHQQRKSACGDPYHASIHSKLQIQVLRLAGVLHAAWCYARPDRDPTTLDDDIMERAWMLADYFEEMAVKVADMIIGRPDEDHGDEIAAGPVLANRTLLAEIVNRFNVRPSELVKVCGLHRSYVTRIGEVIKAQTLQAETETPPEP